MIINTQSLVLLLLCLTGLVVACSSPQPNTQLQDKHPSQGDLGVKPLMCSDCHDAQDQAFSWEQFNHTAFFPTQHRLQANQHQQLCSMCHQRHFCSDCHATRVELKPSLKNQSETFRQMPHRGDYLSRHRIDARIDPTSCFRCHGNPQTAKNCVKCHG